MRPFRIGLGGQLQLAAIEAQIGLACPIPMLAVIVRLFKTDAEHFLQMRRQGVGDLPGRDARERRAEDADIAVGAPRLLGHPFD